MESVHFIDLPCLFCLIISISKYFDGVSSWLCKLAWLMMGFGCITILFYFFLVSLLTCIGTFLMFQSWLCEQQYRAEFHNLSSKLHFLNTSVTLVLDFPLKACDVRLLWLARSGIPLIIWAVLVQWGHPSAGAPEQRECESQISPTWHTLHSTTRLPWCC